MKASLKILLFSLTAAAITGPALAQSTTAGTTAPVLQYAKQGWSVEDRQAFYTTSQGSHMIPYLWFKALRRLDVDEPFGGDQLARYGYLPNEKSKLNPEGLPVGFVLYAPPNAVPRASAFPTSPVSPDAVVLTGFHVVPEFRGAPV